MEQVNNECLQSVGQLYNAYTMKKRSDETLTLRAGCSKPEPKISPRRRPHRSGGAGRPKLNQLEMVTTIT